MLERLDFSLESDSICYILPCPICGEYVAMTPLGMKRILSPIPDRDISNFGEGLWACSADCVNQLAYGEVDYDA